MRQVLFDENMPRQLETVDTRVRNLRRFLPDLRSAIETVPPGAVVVIATA